MFLSLKFILLSCLPVDIEAQILEIQGKKASLLQEGDQGVGLDSTGFYDQEIYGGSDSRFAGYVTSIAANEQEDVSIFLLSAWKHSWYPNTSLPFRLGRSSCC